MVQSHIITTQKYLTKHSKFSFIRSYFLSQARARPRAWSWTQMVEQVGDCEVVLTDELLLHVLQMLLRAVGSRFHRLLFSLLQVANLLQELLTESGDFPLICCNLHTQPHQLHNSKHHPSNKFSHQPITPHQYTHLSSLQGHIGSYIQFNFKTTAA